MEHERAASAEALSAACRRNGCPHRRVENFTEGWKAARRWAGAGGMVIVCGSIAAVGEAFLHRAGEIP
jgi:folylpolyglutamate synthase/dihydropteroate synthase